MKNDPGRVRFAPLFAAMYGDCRKNEVVKNLRAVKWLPKHGGGSVKVTTVTASPMRSERVSRELDELPDDLVTYLVPTAGTYNCRKVAGSRAPSMHAYGAAIDIDTRYADYWRWNLLARRRAVAQPYSGRDRARSSSGTASSGAARWYHYDTMHFEYRPELLRQARRRIIHSVHPRESGDPGQRNNALRVRHWIPRFRGNERGVCCTRVRTAA